MLLWRVMSRTSRWVLFVIGLSLVGVAGCRPTESLPESGTSAGSQQNEIDPELAKLFRELEIAVRENPEDAVARGRLGMARHANGLLSLALEDYREASALSSSDPKWWYLASSIHADLADLPRAVAALDSAAARAPGSAQVHWRQGFLFLDLDNLDAAGAAFDRAIQLRPNLAIAKIGRARVHLQRGEADRAAAILEDVLQRTPDNFYAPYTHQLLGTAYRSMGRLDEARAEFAQGGQSRPTFTDPWSADLAQFRVSSGSRLRAAAALIDAGENEKAATLLEEVRAEGSPSVTALNYLSVAYMNLGRVPEAQKVLEALIEQNPEDAIAHANLSLAFSKLGDDAQALRYADRAVELNPWLPFTHVQRARVLARLGKKEDAAREYAEAIRLSPNAPEILLAGAAVAEDLQRWQEVDSLATRVLLRNPKHVDALVRRGRARTNLGRFHDARDDLVAAAALRPNDVEIRNAQDVLARRAAGPPGGAP